MNIDSLDLSNPAAVIGAGLLLGLSLAYFVAVLPVFRKPSLDDRIAPYLRDRPRVAKMYGPPVPADAGVLGLARSLAVRAGEWLSSRLTTDASIITRLSRLGPSETIEKFRAHQILLIAAGIVSGALLGTLVSIGRGFNPAAFVLIPAMGGVCGHFLNDWLLSRRVRRREERILAEFPTIAELLALSITAGEGTVDALERSCRSTTGELSEELRSTLAEARTGTPLIEALDNLGRRTGIPSIVQFVDGIAVAIARGTPLAEVLRAQAGDVREEGRRRLMELSGKKEVGMLVPVVLFVLPVTVLFAVFPSLAVLELTH
ncbi:type II secretion system F family protein [Brevibacterium daeguense]|uniref:Type II secretion system F family protein n=1 Tax=Brevibacterium daeguense TaxID=909936 RepID=A0ABP8EFT9_9MICO|nr:type II secretion system F family protein [Brevibacterium daeguense]